VYALYDDESLLSLSKLWKKYFKIFFSSFYQKVKRNMVCCKKSVFLTSFSTNTIFIGKSIGPHDCQDCATKICAPLGTAAHPTPGLQEAQEVYQKRYDENTTVFYSFSAGDYGKEGDVYELSPFENLVCPDFAILYGDVRLKSKNPYLTSRSYQTRIVNMGIYGNLYVEGALSILIQNSTITNSFSVVVNENKLTEVNITDSQLHTISITNNKGYLSFSFSDGTLKSNETRMAFNVQNSGSTTCILKDLTISSENISHDGLLRTRNVDHGILDLTLDTIRMKHVGMDPLFQTESLGKAVTKSTMVNSDLSCENEQSTMIVNRVLDDATLQVHSRDNVHKTNGGPQCETTIHTTSHANSFHLVNNHWKCVAKNGVPSHKPLFLHNVQEGVLTRKGLGNIEDTSTFRVPSNLINLSGAAEMSDTHFNETVNNVLGDVFHVNTLNDATCNIIETSTISNTSGTYHTLNAQDNSLISHTFSNSVIGAQRLVSASATETAVINHKMSGLLADLAPTVEDSGIEYSGPIEAVGTNINLNIKGEGQGTRLSNGSQLKLTGSSFERQSLLPNPLHSVSQDCFLKSSACNNVNSTGPIFLSNHPTAQVDILASSSSTLDGKYPVISAIQGGILTSCASILDGKGTSLVHLGKEAMLNSNATLFQQPENRLVVEGTGTLNTGTTFNPSDGKVSPETNLTQVNTVLKKV
jgi:hypothetical protein